MHNLMVMLTFPFFYPKYPFWAKFVQKNKIFSLSWNLLPRLIRICTIQYWCSLCLRLGIPFLGKFGPKGQNCQFKLKFGFKSAKFNSEFTLSVFNRKYLFWTNLAQKIKIISLSWNLVLRLIRVWLFNAEFIFFWPKNSFLEQIYPTKIEVVCWSWNLEPRLIEICRIWRWFSIFPLLDRKYYFSIN